ncbi:PHP domain-containing protein [Heliophilum fasciatum]|uniref:Polymerase/histidinol phosphatase N-terminal domain-containing protein n=1 Tax=Heliophilum fasciatum TaxID=35700 RepID=A0A4R2RGI2_9FIRM|nr:PHP domain-containing protein [Heliophilum fasciatum]MCW2278920.1 putative metal-dependent phosphoesterase TrpH [Heliophilum fasciatum]TCP62053.1 hypothetical protein EDD73_12427 [Heliophilum fasciatum]
MRIDLHLHSRASDGVQSPMEILQAAVRHQVSVMALTDHETVDGYCEVQQTAATLGLKLIAGVELLVYHDEWEVHLLGYGMDVQNQAFLAQLRRLCDLRNQAAQETVAKLQHLGFDLPWDAVVRLANPQGAISKGHIIYALHQRGALTPQTRPFSQRYLDPGAPAHVPYRALSFTEGVALIRQAGGVPVIAHPALIKSPDVLPQLLHSHDVGIEVYYGYFGEQRKKWVDEIEKIALQHHCLMTGGTDYHGPYSVFQPGEVPVPPSVWSSLQDAINAAQKNYRSRVTPA